MTYDEMIDTILAYAREAGMLNDWELTDDACAQMRLDLEDTCLFIQFCEWPSINEAQVMIAEFDANVPYPDLWEYGSGYYTEEEFQALPYEYQLECMFECGDEGYVESNFLPFDVALQRFKAFLDHHAEYGDYPVQFFMS